MWTCIAALCYEGARGLNEVKGLCDDNKKKKGKESAYKTDNSLTLIETMCRVVCFNKYKRVAVTGNNCSSGK